MPGITVKSKLSFTTGHGAFVTSTQYSPAVEIAIVLFVDPGDHRNVASGMDRLFSISSPTQIVSCLLLNFLQPQPGLQMIIVLFFLLT